MTVTFIDGIIALLKQPAAAVTLIAVCFVRQCIVEPIKLMDQKPIEMKG